MHSKKSKALALSILSLATYYFNKSVAKKGLFIMSNAHSTVAPLIWGNILVDMRNITTIYSDQLIKFIDDNPKMSGTCMTYLFGKEAVNINKGNLDDKIFGLLKTYITNDSLGRSLRLFSKYKVSLANGTNTDLYEMLHAQQQGIKYTIKTIGNSTQQLGSYLSAIMGSGKGEDLLQLANETDSSSSLAVYKKPDKDWDSMLKSMKNERANYGQVANTKTNSKIYDLVASSAQLGFHTAGEYSCKPLKTEYNRITNDMEADMAALETDLVQKGQGMMTNYTKDHEGFLSTRNELIGAGTCNVIWLFIVLYFLSFILRKVGGCCARVVLPFGFSTRKSTRKSRRRRRSVRKRSVRKRSRRRSRRRSVRKRSRRRSRR